ncbi:M14 family zinc carboxypeptidase [Cognatitamlana onchidii]|uniref:M14 family zinc carboxypeptidase n=1 Tax=Cognatitamlana onchidii TaxID=2562860 RepID=UPI0010A5F4B3|nr:M14 family zinc carboxypeptidase [Algibacter onchidii]
MQTEEIRTLFSKYKEESLSGRYITHKHIAPLIEKLKSFTIVNQVGKSVLGNPIHSIEIGSGRKKILMWSQMHGNESTTTKAIFDLLNTLLSDNQDVVQVLDNCKLCIIPILNPDGAMAYTRVNANSVDLNRDAQDLSQPESLVLKEVFERFKPHFCYNLHGQRTIFSAGPVNKSATVSFLAPAQDKECSVTLTRKKAMEIIDVMNKRLQEIIPDQVGVYDDSFNINCVGDTFQSKNVPTILFEAGHYDRDYDREVTRELIYISYLTSICYISKNNVDGSAYKEYFNIPENEKCFLDIIIRNVKMGDDVVDVGIQYTEKLNTDSLEFVPVIVKVESLHAFYGHKEYDAKGSEVSGENGEELKVNYENVFVILNNEKILL